MTAPITRRDLLKVFSAQALAAAGPGQLLAGPIRTRLAANRGVISGNMTGAQALVEALKQEGCGCVFGIPGAQENELWDTMKAKHLPYLLVTHEFSASTMADGYARSTGKAGVLCIVPGPGVTNSLSGLGESLLDSIPIVAIVGDIGNGHHARAFQVHSLDQTALLRPVTKQVLTVQEACEIPGAVRAAFRLACAGEPGPVAVVVPYNLFIESAHMNSGPLEPLGVPFDETAAEAAYALLSDHRKRVGIYAGLGCMDYMPGLVRLAETLQAPVATSMSGKGCFPENHPLSVGWGYGPQGTRTAEAAFSQVDLLLAIGVKYGEVSTGFYSQPQHRCLIHVDINQDNLGRVMRATACVHADAGVFITHALERAELVRPENCNLVQRIRQCKINEARENSGSQASCNVEPMAFLRALRHEANPDALAFIDVTMSQYWAAEVYETVQPRTFFNPTNNQAMGWSIPAALGAQMANPHTQTFTVTGDGCFLMSAMEISTAARAGLPVKFFILDDHAYHYMQELQRPAYLRTTATILSMIDYRAFAAAVRVPYFEILSEADLCGDIREILHSEGPALVRVATSYGRRRVRWLRAARDRFTAGLTRDQRARFIARIAYRSLDPMPEND